MRLLERKPEASQRLLAAELGVSLGKVNYCLRTLIDRGLVQVRSFRSRKQNRRAHAYQLTRSGLEEKERIASRFLAHKQREQSAIKAEILALRAEVAAIRARLKGRQ